MAPDRWRWKIRPGVKFHNGAPFNAAAAKFGLEYNAIPPNVSAAVTWLGPDIKGEVGTTSLSTWYVPRPVLSRPALASLPIFKTQSGFRMLMKVSDLA